MCVCNVGEWYSDDKIGGYFAEDGYLVVCVEYGLSDSDTCKYFTDVMNGYGFYDENGKFIRRKEEF